MQCSAVLVTFKMGIEDIADPLTPLLTVTGRCLAYDASTRISMHMHNSEWKDIVFQ